MLRKWWFWSIVVFLILEAVLFFILVYQFERNWEYFPFNQEDAVGFITIPLALAFIPLIIRNMRRGGVIPIESSRGRFLNNFSIIPAIIGIAIFFGSNFRLELYDYHFLSFSSLIFGLMLSGVLSTMVTRKPPETAIFHPPKHIRWILIVVILGLNVAMFLNIDTHPFWIYSLAIIGVFLIYKRIAKSYQ